MTVCGGEHTGSSIIALVVFFGVLIGGLIIGTIKAIEASK